MQANGKKNLENYIQIALKARENKTEFPFIVFDKNQENTQEVLVFTILIWHSKRYN